jgi:hypothetical protein
VDFPDTTSEQSPLTKDEQDMIRRYGALQSAISDIGDGFQTILNQKNVRIRELEAQAEALKKLDSLAPAPIEHRPPPLATQDLQHL